MSDSQVGYRPLMDLPDGVYNYGPRQVQDRIHSFVYGAMVLASLGLGIYAGHSVNPHYAKLAVPDQMMGYSHCHDTSLDYRRSLMENDSINGTKFLADSSVWLVVAFIGALVLGVAFLSLFRTHARATVWGVIYFKVLSLAILGLYLGSGAVPGAAIGGILIMCLAAFTAFVFWLWRYEIDLVGRLLAVSACSLKDNPHIITVTLFLKFCLFLLLVPIAAGITLAYMNGDLAPNPNAVPSKAGADTCVDGDGDAVPCCAWRPDGWAQAYMALAGATALWSVMLAFEMRLFTVGGVVAQWYFAPPGTTSFKGTTLGALRHAVGPSFGSLCFGSLILAAIQVAREMNNQARRNARGGGAAAFLACLLTACLDCIYALIEQVSKYATIQCAITGAGFCDAAMSVSRLLRDNLLSAYGVWWLPGMILQTASFVIAAGFGTAIALAAWASWTAAPGHYAPGAEAALLGCIAFVMAIIVLGFCMTVLLNVVDAVFICYAMDKERAMTTKVEVHEVFLEVVDKNKRADAARADAAVSGPVVQQPGGGMAYANPHGVNPTGGNAV